MILAEEILRMQKSAVFHLISKHLLNINFLSIFLTNYKSYKQQQQENPVQISSVFDSDNNFSQGCGNIVVTFMNKIVLHVLGYTQPDNR